MKTGASLKNRQGGAVAVMVGISMVVLIGFLAMVIDLGRLYVARAGLQNAADAAALAGAKELNGTAAGVTSAISNAVNVANKNNYDFSIPVATTPADLDIWVCGSPDNCTVLASTAASDTTNLTAAGKTFLKVHTRNRNLVAWFAPIWNIFTTSTFGMAVAGRYQIDVAPIGVCAIDPDPEHGICTDKVAEKSSPNGELLEWGFRRGVAYNIADLNPLGPGDPLWLNGINSYPLGCKSSSGSEPNTTPLVCVGAMNAAITKCGGVYRNSGLQKPTLVAINSRFGIYNPPDGTSECVENTAPPDRNIREYRCTKNGNPEKCGVTGTTNLPRDWMAPSENTTPTQQTISIDPVTRKPIPAPIFTQYGVLWAYSRPVQFAASHTPFDLEDWPNLYASGVADTTADGYPGTASSPYPASSPYATTTGKYAENRASGVAGRRVLNIAIVDCGITLPSEPNCDAYQVLGVGKFFLQSQVDRGTHRIPGEFAGLVDLESLKGEIRLFR